MAFMKELFHRDDLVLSGTFIERKAVRGVIRKNGKILLVHLKGRNEYKFPGGGANGNELSADILKREILEETGGVVREIKGKLGTVIEYNRKDGDSADFFKMISEYYEVIIEDDFQKQDLDPWEADLEFLPVWIDIAEAAGINRANIAKNGAKKSDWIERETLVLNELIG